MLFLYTYVHFPLPFPIMLFMCARVCCVSKIFSFRVVEKMDGWMDLKNTNCLKIICRKQKLECENVIIYCVLLKEEAVPDIRQSTVRGWQKMVGGQRWDRCLVMFTCQRCWNNKVNWDQAVKLGLWWDFQEMSQQCAHKPAAGQLTAHIRALTAPLIPPPCGKLIRFPLQMLRWNFSSHPHISLSSNRPPPSVITWKPSKAICQSTGCFQVFQPKIGDKKPKVRSGSCYSEKFQLKTFFFFPLVDFK